MTNATGANSIRPNAPEVAIVDRRVPTGIACGNSRQFSWVIHLRARGARYYFCSMVSANEERPAGMLPPRP
jgi:hypothetical protein